MKQSSNKVRRRRLRPMTLATASRLLCLRIGRLTSKAILPALLLSCSEKNAPALPDSPSLRPATPTAKEDPVKTCTEKEVWKVGNFTYDELPWGRSIHKYDEPRFDRKSERRENQKRTKAIIRNTVEVMSGSESLYRFLKLIAMRESSLIGNNLPFDSMGVVHRLSADQDSAYRSWQMRRDDFKGNPLISDSSLWKTYGPYGMNTNYALHHFDDMADPRALGDTVAATVTQIVKIAYVAAKLGGDVVCQEWSGDHVINIGWNGQKWKRGVPKRGLDGKPIKSPVYVPRTWYTIHRGVQSGRVCPAWKGDTLERALRKSFERRAATNRIRPHKEVPVKDLGIVPDNPYHAWAQAWTLSGVKAEKTTTKNCK